MSCFAKHKDIAQTISSKSRTDSVFMVSNQFIAGHFTLGCSTCAAAFESITSSRGAGKKERDQVAEWSTEADQQNLNWQIF